jgi:hypothetical protein
MVYYLLRCLALSFLFLISAGPIQTGQAQSSTLDSTGSSTRRIGAGVIRSRNEKYDSWERILDSNIDRFGDNAILRVADLPRILGESGLPVVIDQSAEDDAGSNATFQLPLAGGSLRSRLLHGLEKINLCWAFGESAIKIVSRDAANEGDYFFLVSYSVSQGSKNPQRDIEKLWNLIVESINPDNWQTTQGEQSISPAVINGHVVLIINASYDTHRKIEQLFDQLSDLTVAGRGAVGESVLANTLEYFGQDQGTVPIEVPLTNKVRKPQAPRPTQPSTSPKPVGGGF